ncbi:MAG: hypothetical protein CL781_00215 [Chloroflexi bacterium]|nr:hypothetical protein [Chloroflexota bacterium]|tara:strand:- start:1240 stop:2490 length:1251 start_codon:yes stop_codon:yes gene_type:complete
MFKLRLFNPKKLYHGWYVSFAACCSELGNHCASITLLSLFVMPMVQEFGWSRTVISVPASLGSVFGAALSPFVGKLVDVYGARYILPLAAVVLALSCLYMSMLQTILAFFITYTIIRTIDQGVINSATYPTVGKWFAKYKGRATSLIMLTGAIAAAISGPLYQLIIGELGWRIAWITLALFPLIFGILPAFLLIRKNPEAMGLAVDGISSGSNLQQSTTYVREWTVKEAVRTRFFWCVFVSLFMVGAAGPGITLHFAAHLSQQGVSPVIIGSTVSVFAISGAFGITIAGLLADRFNIKYLMIIGCSVATLSLVILIRADSMLETFIFVSVWGFSLITVHPLIPVLWNNVFGREILGTINGLSRVTLVMGLAVGPVISGFIYDLTNAYQGAFWVFMAGSFVSVILLIVSGDPNKNRK